jgi:DNA-binding transcriptional ArsR family regulator
VFLQLQPQVIPSASAPLPTPQAERMAQICKALAHPARIRILVYLKRLNQCVCGQIVDHLPLAQSTVSQHLKILKQAGLIRGEIDGPRTCYCLDPTVVEELKGMFQWL